MGRPLHATFRALLLATAGIGLLAMPEAVAQSPRRAAPAAAPQPQGVITSVDIRGNQRIEAETIRSYMLLQPGDPYDPDRSDRSLRSLFQTGLFRDVRITRDGSRLVVQVQENPIVNRVAFEGNRRISDDNIRPEIQLRARSVFTPQLAQGDRQRILDLYARRGRYAARVEPKIIELDQNRVDVVFEITEGEVAQVARINFVGNSAFSDSRLREVVATKEQAFYRIFSTSDTFDPDRLSFDRELLRRYYLRNGYPDIQVGNPSAELAPDRSGFFITYPMTEGQRFSFGEITITSAFPNLNTQELRRFIEIRSGDWYDGDAVERTSQAIADAANLRGFPFVDVQPQITRDTDARRINITFAINEAPRIFVERIDIEGNTRTQDRVIRREFRLAEGDAFNAAQVRRSRERIRNLNYFGDVQITSAPGSAPDRTIITTRLQERATGEVSVGGGYSTDAGFLADFGIRERNLSGTGLDARIAATIAQRRSQLDLSITDPAFLDRNLALGADVFYIQRNLLNIANYSERRAGFALRAGWEFNERLRQNVSYSLVQREVYNIQAGASRYVTEQRGSTLLSQVSQTLSYDTRDNFLEPRRGYLIRLGTDLAGLGGDVAYFRGRLDGGLHLPFERILGHEDYVLSFTASVGILESFGNRPDRIVDRFFLGGENLRGFALAGAGPRDLNTGDALGGRFMWTQSSEFRFPLPVPSELGLIGRAFVDIGSLSRTVAGTGIGDTAAPRVGAGVGISWRSPFGLINIDVAQAVAKQRYDETQVVRFGFGTRF
ncbi:outer membrane protein assembly factor BamA [Sabulicella glaciei]|uniref:Outer membrane protein assembly factor BamA n=1 Tax=Sabulicella glaciei TaxID=2984948 RepID=A0ABT3NPK9_9PROT|nr:outer membrane protein assembly factor BamA [Roseococcus sp. MDT2-1-1]MCW8084085.1 outer membrane protein assembly factor BamA [Roseococcus sp. MDT2-1-1]